MKPKQLEDLLKKKKVLLLDVREKQEYAKGGRIIGAKNVPMGQVFLNAVTGKLPKDKKIVTACKKGGRCKIVAKELRKKGYNIEHLEGGIDAWKEAKEQEKQKSKKSKKSK